MTEAQEEAPLELQLYTFTLKDGSQMESVLHGVHSTESMLHFLADKHGTGQVESVGGIAIDALLYYTVSEVADPAHEDEAPAIMDSGDGYTPGQFVRAGNPYAPSTEGDEEVPDPFRGGMRFAK